MNWTSQRRNALRKIASILDAWPRLAGKKHSNPIKPMTSFPLNPRHHGEVAVRVRAATRAYDRALDAYGAAVHAPKDSKHVAGVQRARSALVRAIDELKAARHAHDKRFKVKSDWPAIWSPGR